MLRPPLGVEGRDADAEAYCQFGRFCRCALILLTALGMMGSFLALPAVGQTPSDADTMRILNAAALPGDTVAVSFYLRNVNVLSGYNFRLRYNPTLIEPLTDTTIFGTDSTIWVEAQQLRGTGFEVFGGNVRSPGLMTFVAVDIDHMVGTIFLPGGGAAVRMRWRVLPGAPTETTTIDFENDPIFPQSWNTIVDFEGGNFKRPVLVSGLFEILTCSCGSQGDINDNGISYEIGDVISLIDYTFNNAPAPPKDASCYHVNRGEITCDAVVDVRDVVRMICIIAGMRPPTCDPCACNPYPSGCP